VLTPIGGAARAGETLLARRLLAERGVPCFCCDYLVSAPEQGAPLVWPRLLPLLHGLSQRRSAALAEAVKQG
jgi:hypothetical protein